MAHVFFNCCSDRAMLLDPRGTDILLKSLLIGSVLTFFLSVPSNAPAQSYILNAPGQTPTIVNPEPGGGYIVNAPGQPPAIINPQLGGGYIINAPGPTLTIIGPKLPQPSYLQTQGQYRR